jgi:hypothetical protein
MDVLLGVLDMPEDIVHPADAVQSKYSISK